MDICPSARKFLDTQAIYTLTKIFKNLHWLESNPHLAPDDSQKRLYFAPPVVLRIFQDDNFWVIYYLEHGLLKVANIGDASEEPRLHR